MGIDLTGVCEERVRGFMAARFPFIECGHDRLQVSRHCQRAVKNAEAGAVRAHDVVFPVAGYMRVPVGFLVYPKRAASQQDTAVRRAREQPFTNIAAWIEAGL